MYLECAVNASYITRNAMASSSDVELKEVTVSAVQSSSAAQEWRMALAFRRYQKGDGFLAWAAAHWIGRHGVMHCDIIMTVPCGEVRCGCERTVDDDCCKSGSPFRRCKPCRYRDLESLPDGITSKQRTQMLNYGHPGNGHVHIVTFTALETGVICRMERDFNYHHFYRIHATNIQADLAEEFMIEQIGAKYNFVGSRCNFNPLLPCFRYLCPCGATWDDFDPEVDPETGRVIEYSEKIVHWKWFCSEFAAATMCQMGLEGFRYDSRELGCAEPCTISPDDLFDIVNRRIQQTDKNKRSLTFSNIAKDDVVRSKADSKKKA